VEEFTGSDGGRDSTTEESLQRFDRASLGELTAASLSGEAIPTSRKAQACPGVSNGSRTQNRVPSGFVLKSIFP
jgi:hypothetical protein